ncbi:MAG: FAD-dependent oxidoreductase [Synechococcus sp. BS307-5m-G38]|nr:FAD-dependent oxidoreductase [Synechococcus sp. BS307-5m-G38]
MPQVRILSPRLAKAQFPAGFSLLTQHNTTRPEARSGVLEYHEGNWPANPWVSGAYSTIYTPGTWTQFGKHLRQPVGRIFWAGTEVSTAWPGDIHGALQASEESAAA